MLPGDELLMQRVYVDVALSHAGSWPLNESKNVESSGRHYSTVGQWGLYCHSCWSVYGQIPSMPEFNKASRLNLLCRLGDLLNNGKLVMQQRFIN